MTDFGALTRVTLHYERGVRALIRPESVQQWDEANTMVAGISAAHGFPYPEIPYWYERAVEPPLPRTQDDPERPWPPRTIREWIALAYFDLARDGSPYPWKEAQGAMLEDLEHFLAWDYEHFEDMGPGEATHYPPRTAPPAVGPETEWGFYP